MSSPCLSKACITYKQDIIFTNVIMIKYIEQGDLLVKVSR